MQRKDMREVIERLDQIIDALNQIEKARETSEQARARQDKLNTKANRRWQFSLGFLSISFAIIALGVAINHINSYTYGSIIAFAAGFFIYCLAGYGVLSVNWYAQR